MPLIKACSRCGTTLLMPSERDGKSFCSPECEALYRDPDILKKLSVEAPAVVRLRASILLVVSLAVSIYLICFPPAIGGQRWLFASAFSVPLYFLVEVLTGKSFQHASLWYQSLREWQRALIVLGVMLTAFGGFAGSIYLYVKNSPKF